MALNIALNNISLLDITLSLNQVIRYAFFQPPFPPSHLTTTTEGFCLIPSSSFLHHHIPPIHCRSSIPVVTCILAVVVEGQYPTQQELTALIVLTVGVMIAVWQGTIGGKPYAIFFCIAGTICNGAMMTFSGKILSEKLDVVRLTFYTAPISLLCLSPFLVWRELDNFLVFYTAHSSDVTGILLASCVNAVCYNMIHSLMIKRSSAVSTTVIGEVKIVALLILSALLLGEGKEFTPKMLVGCSMAMVGFIMYSHAKLAKVKLQMPSNILGLSRNNSSSDVEETQPLKAVTSPPVTYRDVSPPEKV